MTTGKTHDRRCILCGAEIDECMGICLARDVLMVLRGEKRDWIRETCGRCAMTDSLRPRMFRVWLNGHELRSGVDYSSRKTITMTYVRLCNGNKKIYGNGRRSDAITVCYSYSGIMDDSLRKEKLLK